MEKWIGSIRISFIWVQLMLLLYNPWVSLVTSQPGFLSIDCGSEQDYVDNLTGIYWVTDANYISTGKNAKNITARSFNPIVNKLQMETLRYFAQPRRRDCYCLPVTPDTTVLIRPTFFFGDWNGTSTSAFYVSLNNTNWFRLDYGGGIDRDYTTYGEAIVYSPGSELNFCLVRDEGPSFISTLELRELDSSMYTAAGLQTINAYLSLQYRANCGASQSGPSFLRYPDDAYDRLWATPGAWDNATHITNSLVSSSSSCVVPDRPPPRLMQSAWIYYDSNILWFYIDFGVPVGKVYITSYFQELDGNASATNVRGMIYHLNDRFLKSFNSSDEPLEIYGPVQTIPENYVNISFLQASWSRLRPTLNAFEIYNVYDFDVSKTADEDVSAVSALQTRLDLTGWTGDPCLPVPYDWLSCTADDGIPTLFRVTNLSLADQGIMGAIPPELLNLTALTDISLNNNHLTGTIPDLSSLVHLRTLYLQNNSLTGNIPSFLGSGFPNLTQLNVDNNYFTGVLPPDIAGKKGLNFSYSNNPGLPGII